jgi:hypothetical protein
MRPPDKFDRYVIGAILLAILIAVVAEELFQ